MEDTKMDEYGRQLCPSDDSILQLYGAWSFNGRIYPDSYSFRCNRCHTGYVGSGVEVEMHQDGMEAARKENEVLTVKLKVARYKGTIDLT